MRLIYGTRFLKPDTGKVRMVLKKLTVVEGAEVRLPGGGGESVARCDSPTNTLLNRIIAQRVRTRYRRLWRSTIST
jgi:hypothetical protein